MEIRKLNEKEILSKIEDFTSRICQEARFKDLNPQAIETFRNMRMEYDNTANIKDLKQQELLNLYGVMLRDKVTYAGLILFGSKKAIDAHLPLSEIVYQYYKDSEGREPDARMVWREGFFGCFMRILEELDENNLKRFNVIGSRASSVFYFNKNVTRELFINAVCHRDYMSRGSVFIIQRPESLVFENPAGLLDDAFLKNIYEKRAPRNPKIFEILSLCGLTEGKVKGMDIVQSESVRELRPYPLILITEENALQITTRIPAFRHYFEIQSKLENPKSLSTSDYEVIYEVLHHGSVSESLLPRVDRLQNIGIIRLLPDGRFEIGSGIRRSQKGRKKDETFVSIDKELVLKILRERGKPGITLKELQNYFPDKSRMQVYTLINYFRDKGMVINAGKGTKASRWLLTEYFKS